MGDMQADFPGPRRAKKFIHRMAAEKRI